MQNTPLQTAGCFAIPVIPARNINFGGGHLVIPCVPGANASGVQRRNHFVGVADSHQQRQDVVNCHLMHFPLPSGAAVADNHTLNIPVLGVPGSSFNAALSGYAPPPKWFPYLGF